MANIVKDIGAVSAYALAVKHGFKGTEEEWAKKQADAGTNAQRAEAAATDAEAAAHNATAQADNAASSAQKAQTAQTNAAEQATNAANSANAAADSATKAETAKQNVNSTIQNAVANATAAAQASATNAANSANAAAQSASAAQASATSAAQSATDAAASAQEAREVVQTAAQIDDAVASFERVWSSQRTVNRLCPKFEAGGQVVSCYPVEGYPLNVISQITAKQEGTGEPSPENIRPISGWAAATVTRCGKNLLPYPYLDKTKESNGISWTINDDGSVTVNGTATGYSNFSLSNKNIFKDGITYYLPTPRMLVNIVKKDGTNDWKSGKVTWDAEWSLKSIYFQVNPNITVDNQTLYPMITTEENTAFELYKGDTYTVDFDETVYGGYYDWSAGELTITHKKIELTGMENWGRYGETGAYNSYLIQLPTGVNETGIAAQCSHYPNILKYGDLYYGRVQACYVGYNLTNSAALVIGTTYQTVTEFKTYLAEQYAAGTPVTVVYQLAEPIMMAMEGQTLAALDGVNTLYSVSGETSVRGRADPVRVMEQVMARVAALESAVIDSI